jgi:tRNA dimethylallyltransferase
LTESSDAGSYLRMAQPVIEEIQSRGKTPVIVGGSGLYLKFLTHGPSPLPTGDASLRAELHARPLEDLVAQLESLDPVEAARTALHNKRYVSRALEICLLSGRKASELRDQWESSTAARSASLRGVFIQRTRPDLHHRIALRTRVMLVNGRSRAVMSQTEGWRFCRRLHAEQDDLQVLPTIDASRGKK